MTALHTHDGNHHKVIIAAVLEVVVHRFHYGGDVYNRRPEFYRHRLHPEVAILWVLNRNSEDFKQPRAHIAPTTKLAEMLRGTIGGS